MFGYQVADLQSDLNVAGGKITGTLHKQTVGDLVDTYGEGYFMAIQLGDISEGATSVKVGMDPSEGTGLVEIINDPDLNGAFKVTNKDTQVFKVVTTIDGEETTQTFDLTGLVMEE